MTFPEPNITRSYELLTYANTVTGGVFGAVVVLSTFIIAYVAMKDYRSTAAFAASSFITCLVAILMRILGALQDDILFITIFLAVGGVAALIFEGKWGN